MALAACGAAGNRGDWCRAVMWAQHGLALRVDEPEANWKFQFYLGTAAMYLGDLFRAKRELRGFVASVERTARCRPWLGHALFNLGYVSRCLGNLGEEVEYFKRAGSAYLDSGLDARATVCCYEVAWALLLAGRSDEEVLIELTAVEKALDRLSDPELALDLQIGWALYHSLVGNLDKSSAICSDIVQQEGTPSRQLADVMWIWACNAERQGDFQGAVAHCQIALEAALDDYWPPQVKRVEDLRRRLVASSPLQG